MIKKGYLLNIQTLVIIVAILIAFFYFNSNSGVASIFESSTKETTTNTITTETITLEEETDLCALFQPYIVAGDTISACNLLGGEWTCREDFVGCTNTMIASVDCSGPVIQTAMYQCQSVGGEYFCDTNNAYCVQ